MLSSVLYFRLVYYSVALAKVDVIHSMLSSVLYFRLVYYSVALAKDSGGGEIRTHDTVSGIPHFECGAFGHSATPP